METNTAPPARKSFVRLGQKPQMAALIKEAKRVGYKVEKDDMLCKITDPENGHKVVTICRVHNAMYAFTYYTEYWGEPPMP